MSNRNDTSESPASNGTGKDIVPAQSLLGSVADQSKKQPLYLLPLGSAYKEVEDVRKIDREAQRAEARAQKEQLEKDRQNARTRAKLDRDAALKGIKELRNAEREKARAQREAEQAKAKEQRDNQQPDSGFLKVDVPKALTPDVPQSSNPEKKKEHKWFSGRKTAPEDIPLLDSHLNSQPVEQHTFFSAETNDSSFDLGRNDSQDLYKSSNYFSRYMDSSDHKNGYPLSSDSQRQLNELRAKAQQSVNTAKELGLLLPEQAIDFEKATAEKAYKDYQNDVKTDDITQADAHLQTARDFTAETLYQSMPPTDIETRMNWLDRRTIVNDIRNPAGMAKYMLDQKLHGVNEVYIEVNNGGFAEYNSKLLTKNPELVEQSNWDPVRSAVESGHAVGIKVKAWMHVFEQGDTRFNKLIPEWISEHVKANAAAANAQKKPAGSDAAKEPNTSTIIYGDSQHGFSVTYYEPPKLGVTVGNDTKPVVAGKDQVKTNITTLADAKSAVGVPDQVKASIAATSDTKSAVAVQDQVKTSVTAGADAKAVVAAKESAKASAVVASDIKSVVAANDQVKTSVTAGADTKLVIAAKDQVKASAAAVGDTKPVAAVDSKDQAKTTVPAVGDSKDPAKTNTVAKVDVPMKPIELPWENWSGPILEKHPDWALRTADGKMRAPGSTEFWIDPRNKPACDFLLDVAKEVVSTGVDGFQFDKIRYPFPFKTKEMGTDPGGLLEYKNDTKISLKPDMTESEKDAWHQWKEQNITRFVKEGADIVRKENPQIKIGAAVFALSKEDRKKSIQQSWEVWSKLGLVDTLEPMIYESDPSKFQKALSIVLNGVEKRTFVIPGISNDKTDMASYAMQKYIAWQMGAAGTADFTGGNQSKEKQDAMKQGPYRFEAVPAEYMPVNATKQLFSRFSKLSNYCWSPIGDAAQLGIHLQPAALKWITDVDAQMAKVSDSSTYAELEPVAKNVDQISSDVKEWLDNNNNKDPQRKFVSRDKFIAGYLNQATAELDYATWQAKIKADQESLKAKQDAVAAAAKGVDTTQPRSIDLSNSPSTDTKQASPNKANDGGKDLKLVSPVGDKQSCGVPNYQSTGTEDASIKKAQSK